MGVWRWSSCQADWWELQHFQAQCLEPVLMAAFTGPSAAKHSEARSFFGVLNGHDCHFSSALMKLHRCWFACQVLATYYSLRHPQDRRDVKRRSRIAEQALLTTIRSWNGTMSTTAIASSQCKTLIFCASPWSSTVESMWSEKLGKIWEFFQI